MTEFKPESSSDSEPDLPDSDARLVAFVQDNVPTVPSAALDLEDRLMAAIATSPATQASLRWQMSWPQTRGWIAIVGCSLLAYTGWQIHRILTPHSTAMELAEVEQLWLKDFNALTEVEGTKPLAEWDWIWLDPSPSRRPPA